MFCYRGRKGGGGGGGGFTVLNSLTDIRQNPRFRRFMPLLEVGSDLSEKALKPNTKSETNKKQLPY